MSDFIDGTRAVWGLFVGNRGCVFWMHVLKSLGQLRDSVNFLDLRLLGLRSRLLWRCACGREIWDTSRNRCAWRPATGGLLEYRADEALQVLAFVFELPCVGCKVRVEPGLRLVNLRIDLGLVLFSQARSEAAVFLITGREQEEKEEQQ